MPYWTFHQKVSKLLKQRFVSEEQTKKKNKNTEQSVDHSFSFSACGRNLFSNPFTSLLVCSASVRVKIVCGNILAK